jgi:hypothetical protein
MTRVGQRGQAAVEGIGIAVLVALLLAAVAAWLVREVRPPDRAPDLVGAVAAPLSREPSPLDNRYPFPPIPPPGWEEGRGVSEPIGDALRAGARGARTAGEVGLEMERAFDRGFRRRLAERARAVADDPLGALAELMRPPDLTGERYLRWLAENRDALRRYAAELRGMPLREALVRASEDGGALAADGAIEGARILARRGLRARLPRVPRPPRRPAPRPGRRG